MSRPRAKKIKLLILDVDGVMTDGKIYLFPAPAEVQQALRKGREKYADKGGYTVSSDSMVEAKGFHAHDGTAMSLAQLGGIKTAIITKRVSETVRIRCRDLRIDHVYQGISDKLAAMQEILTKEGLTAEQAAYLGDDVIDLPAMRACGLAMAVANARESVKQVAHIVTEHVGGDGAVRDAVEYILKAQGTLDRVVAAYIGERSPN
ncbi:MAG: HAD hydrolase family protein [Candidatus Korobacteraceae bacterium]|jgi:3-deoxy-D-manno-octulosonate 8-phosphate phosphatase (KDO 8-P phosphatase)